MKKLLFVGLIVLSVQAARSQNYAAELVVPIGHTEGITAVDISPNGRFVLTAGLDKIAKIWDWATGLEVRTLIGHERNVLAAAFSPVTESDPEGGKYILTGSSDHTALLWDQMGHKRGRFKEPAIKGDVNAVAFSPNGQELLIGLADGSARLLNDTCKEIRRFYHDDAICAVAFSPNGKFILTACKNRTASLWNHTDPSQPVRTYKGHTAGVLSIAFSPTGDTLITGSADGTAILWKISGERIRVFKHAGNIQAVALFPVKGGLKVITGSSDGTIMVWEPGNEDVQPIWVFAKGLNALKLSPDGQYAVLASTSQPAAKISFLDGCTSKWLKGYTNRITAMAISPEGSALLVGHADSTVKIWNFRSQEITSIQYPAKINSVAFSPKTTRDTLGGNYILIGGIGGDGEEKGVSWLRNNRDNTQKELSEADIGVFSPDGKFLLTGNTDGSLKLWDLATVTAREIFHSDGNITALAFSSISGSSAFVMGNNEGSIFFWDSIKAVPASFKPSNLEINSVALSADGKAIVYCSDDGATEILDLRGKSVKKYPNRGRGIQNAKSVAFSPSNRKGDTAGRFVLRSSGKNAELWQISNGKIDTLTGHTSTVCAAIYSPEGPVFTGSEDGSIKIWDERTGKEIATLASLGASDWALSTPSGLYDASTEAIKLMHYTVGMEVISLNQIRERHWNPGLLSIVTGFSTDSVRTAPELDSVSMYPEVTRMSILGNKLEITLNPRNGGIGKVSLFINGNRMEKDINPSQLKTLAPIDLDKYTRFYRSDIPNIIGLVVYNQGGWLRSPVIQKPYQPDKMVNSRGEAGETPVSTSDCGSTKPNLYLIVVGTSKYADTTKNLTYPDYDAQCISSALTATGSLLFKKENVHSKLLTTEMKGDAYPSKDHIKAAFNEFWNAATPCDVLVVYFAGHGATWGEEGRRADFYYLTHDVSSGQLGDHVYRNNHAISDDDIEEWMNKVAAQKKVLILDACHSGQARKNMQLGQRDINAKQSIAMGMLNDRTGAFILAGSAADMVSYEASKYGQGLLTYSLLRGISGAALVNGNVDVLRLFQHAQTEVRDLAKTLDAVQKPEIETNGESFPIGIKDASITITVQEEKPAFLPANIIYSGNGVDTLGIAQALDDYFMERKKLGAKADFVFYETETDGCYKIVGSYKFTGEGVTFTGWLIKNKRAVGKTFTLLGSQNKLKMRDLILKQVISMLPSKGN